jgi:hypothetical protein
MVQPDGRLNPVSSTATRGDEGSAVDAADPEAEDAEPAIE